MYEALIIATRKNTKQEYEYGLNKKFTSKTSAIKHAKDFIADIKSKNPKSKNYNFNSRIKTA